MLLGKYKIIVILLYIESVSATVRTALFQVFLTTFQLRLLKLEMPGIEHRTFCSSRLAGMSFPTFVWP